MRVLISAGEKTGNILGPLSRRFESGAVQLRQEKYIEQVCEYIQKGEIFDRLIVIEQSIIGEDNSYSEREIREKMIQLVEMLEYVDKTATMIFVVTEEKIGNIINDEMFNYLLRTKVIKLNSKYTVSFFVDICTKDMKDIKNGYTGVSEVAMDSSKVDVEDSGHNVEIEVPDTYKDNFNENLASEEDEEEQSDEEGAEEEQIIDTSEAEISRITNTWFTEKDYEIPEQVDNAEDIEEQHDVDTTSDMNDTEVGEDDDDRGKDTYDDDLFSEDIYSSEETDTTISMEDGTNEFSNKEICTEQDGSVSVNINTDSSVRDTDKKTIKKLPWTKKEKKNKQKNIEGQMADANIQIQNNRHVGQEDANELLGEGINEANNDAFGEDLYGTDSIGILGRLEETNIQEVLSYLNIAGSRHSSYIFTGSHGCGVTSIAFNLASIISKLGFSVLYIDCDTIGRGGSFISYMNYDWIHTDTGTRASIIAAINNPSSIDKYVGIIAPGFHTLGMGLDQDARSLNETAKREKFQRFVNLAKENYNFVVYDIPFEVLTGMGEDAAYISDKIIYITDSNTKGFMRMLIDFANIDDDDLRTILFNRANIILNRYRKSTTYFSKKATKLSVILKELDAIVYDVTGTASDHSFADLNFICTVPFLKDIDSSWFSKKSYVDSKEGQDIFLKIAKAIIAK